MSGYVYVITDGTERYKIGFTSSSVESRMANMQTANPRKLSIVCYITTDNYKELEKELHGMFDSKRIVGEWFSLDSEDIYYLKNREDSIFCVNTDNPIQITRSNEIIERIFFDPEMTAEAVRVLFYLITVADSNNVISLSQNRIADTLRITNATVSRIISKLVEKSFLTKEYVGRRLSYILDSSISIKSTTTRRSVA